MNSSVKKWINGKTNSATFKVTITNVRTGHKSHCSGAGEHDHRPHRLRTRSAQCRNSLKDWD